MPHLLSHSLILTSYLWTDQQCMQKWVRNLATFQGLWEANCSNIYRGVICTEVSSATRNYNLQLKLHHNIERYLRGIYLPIFCHSGLNGLFLLLGVQVKSMHPSSCFFTTALLYKYRSSITQAVVDCEHCGTAIMYIIPIVIVLGLQ